MPTWMVMAKEIAKRFWCRANSLRDTCWSAATRVRKIRPNTTQDSAAAAWWNSLPMARWSAQKFAVQMEIAPALRICVVSERCGTPSVSSAFARADMLR